MSEKSQLPIPTAATRDPQSFEIIRVWIAEKGQHVSLRSKVWEDPAAWGLMLADLARHIVNAHNQPLNSEMLQRIRAAFDAELASPTDSPSGQLL
ncbi:MAG TPA: DUF5076 domain-containing protein [Chthoniobacterales bacterium]|jgi:hypothetical protein